MATGLLRNRVLGRLRTFSFSGKHQAAASAAGVTNSSAVQRTVGRPARVRPVSGLNGAMQNLLPEPPATLLPVDEEADAALAAADEDGTDGRTPVAAGFPTYSAAWAALAARALAQARW